MFQFLRIFRPRHDIEVSPHGGKPEAVRLVQILVYPFLIDLVAPRVAGKGVHITGGFLKTPQVLGRIVQEDVLVIDMVAGQQQADRRGERQTAVAPVGGQTFVTHIRSDRSRQVLHVGNRMQADLFIPHPQTVRPKFHILQAGRVIKRQGKVFFHQPRTFRRARYFL